MWLSLALDSYGRVLPDGTPVDRDSYDYRRAAWDAVHFAGCSIGSGRNLRRRVGWYVQYAGCVEPQRASPPHAHFALRGAIPRAVLRMPTPVARKELDIGEGVPVLVVFRADGSRELHPADRIRIDR
ncbi:replication initiator [Micromonospora sp. NPDC047740]|uniref:replication initiator n=1 Tax=Micromonospora sp. NPDC047740 TaxID=3364254 RepID=UPI003722C290